MPRRPPAELVSRAELAVIIAPVVREYVNLRLELRLLEQAVDRHIPAMPHPPQERDCHLRHCHAPCLRPCLGARGRRLSVSVEVAYSWILLKDPRLGHSHVKYYLLKIPRVVIGALPRRNHYWFYAMEIESL